MTGPIYVRDQSDSSILLYVNEYSSSYTIPSDVVIIANGTESNHAFSVCQDQKFTLSFAANSKLQRIGNYSFYKCSGLESIDFTNAQKLVIIYEYAFAYCTSLTSVSFPPSLKDLAYYGTFFGCSNLERVAFDKNGQLWRIDGGSFSSTGLMTVTLPPSVSTIAESAFTSTQIKEFILDGNTHFSVYNGSLYTAGFNTLLCHQKVTPFNISSETKSIGRQSMNGVKSDAIIPSHVTNFMGWAFLFFNGPSLTVYSSISTVGSRMFEVGSNVKEIRLLGKIDKIESGAFKGSNLRAIYFLYPVESVTLQSFSIDYNKVCFAWNVDSIYEMLLPTKIQICSVQAKESFTCHSNNLFGFRPIVLTTIFIFPFSN